MVTVRRICCVRLQWRHAVNNINTSDCSSYYDKWKYVHLL
jgi:hypothetical protein